MTATRPSRFMLKGLILTAVAVFTGGSALWWLNTPLQPPPAAALRPTPMLGPRLQLTFPGYQVVASVSVAAEDADARRKLRVIESLFGGNPARALIATRTSGVPYDVIAHLPNDAVSATDLITRLSAAGITAPNTTWFLAPPQQVSSWEEQTRLMRALYGRLPEREDPRSRSSLAMLADIIVVAKHYGLPLVLFDEIAGLEPDYLDANGFLKDANWRSHPSRGEQVLAYASGRYLTVRRDSVAWQLTEQAMQYGHLLCTRDGSDVQRLPAHLRPPAALADMLETGPSVTYVGRILRDLVDLCGGDIPCAVQALRTNSADTTVRLDLGVRRTALYARRTLHHVGATARALSIR